MAERHTKDATRTGEGFRVWRLGAGHVEKVTSYQSHSEDDLLVGGHAFLGVKATSGEYMIGYRKRGGRRGCST